MPQSWLPYLPAKVLSETADWGFTNSVTSSMGSLLQQGQDLMKPVTEQVTEVARSALPAPAAAPPPSPAPMPEVTPFALPSLASWGMSAPTPAPAARPEPIAMGPQATPSPPAAPAPAQSDSGGLGAAVGGALGAAGFSLPSLEAWGIGPSRAGTSSASRTTSNARPPAGAGAGVSPTSGAATPRASGAGAPTDVNEYLKYAAGKAGIDPAQVLAVMGKEGPTGWGSVGTFDTGTSYGPLQLHYAGGPNPKEGMGDRFTKATGIDLRKDASVQAHQAAVDFAMQELSKRGDFSEWYGADNAFPASQGGQGRFTKVNRVAPSDQPAPPRAAGHAPRFGTYTAENLAVNQVSQGAAEGLTTEEALAVCGPAATLAFARANGGRVPSLREAKELASRLGLWSVDQGMAGPESEVKLLANLGVQARLQPGADWARIAQEVQAGRPVVADTPGHYYVISGYDPRTGEFELGQSAAVLKASKGRTRFRPQDIPSLGMGDVRATIFLGGGQ